jgi:hypothetical protein
VSYPLFIPHDADARAEVFIFNTSSGAGIHLFHHFIRPRGKAHISILAIGSGGNGAAGHTRVSTADGGGGGGGGSGAITRLILPVRLLPESLFIKVGAGGGSGGNSIVLAAPDTNINTENRICIASGGGNAGAGSGTAGGTAGSAGSVTTAANNGPWSSLGQFLSIAGQAGGAGGAHTGANGTTVTFGGTDIPITGGGGGAGSTGTDFVGGQIVGAGGVPSILVGSGFWNFMASTRPFQMTGGAGGNSDDDAIGFSGGDGGIGSGGGGGGAGATGGTGGKGGDGLVVIVCW